MISCEILYHFSQMHFVNEKWGLFLLKLFDVWPTVTDLLCYVQSTATS